jgi:hypothetical protein
MRADSILPPAPTSGPISLHGTIGVNSVLSNGASTALNAWQQELTQVWPQALAFGLLAVGIYLFEWWIDVRKRRSQPEQLKLF